MNRKPEDLLTESIIAMRSAARTQDRFLPRWKTASRNRTLVRFFKIALVREVPLANETQ